MELGRRNINTSLVALIKRAFSSALKDEKVTVKLENEQVFKDYFNKTAQQLRSVESALHRLREEGMSLPETTLDLDTGTEEILQKIHEALGSIEKTLPQSLKSFQEAIEKKEMVVNVPKFPEIVFPKKQEITGAVRVDNPTDMSELKKITKKLGDVQKAVQNIYIPQPKEVVVPKVDIPSFPKSIEMKDSQKILLALQELKESIEKIHIDIPEVEFPSVINVGNFPPQKVPQPVTHVSINSLTGFVKTTSTTITTALTPLPSEVLSNRRSIILYNNSSSTIEIGGSEFAFGNGLPIPASSYSPILDAGPRMIVYGRTSSGSADVRVLEVSDQATGR